MSSISAGTTSGTALVSTADTTGVLVLKTNGTTTAITLSTTGAVGVGSIPSYGNVGQVLTSGGSTSSPTWVTSSGGAQGFVTQYQGVSSAPTMNSFSIALI